MTHEFKLVPDDPFIFEVQTLSNGADGLNRRIPICGEPPDNFTEYGTILNVQDQQGRPVGQAQINFNAESIAGAFTKYRELKADAIKQMTKPKIALAGDPLIHNRMNGVRP